MDMGKRAPAKLLPRSWYEVDAIQILKSYVEVELQIHPIKLAMTYIIIGRILKLPSFMLEKSLMQVDDALLRITQTRADFSSRLRAVSSNQNLIMNADGVVVYSMNNWKSKKHSTPCEPGQLRHS
ncbi:unnamed protein product [Darwinula stevensoni]|uniref:Uncharacterized protein n=1 Tax=Darwinula stevensoni TaxID=69355 RepID=A0A7R8XED0_9CRUS|nr:unnamed protein product [Darwinula stevensoni]CAG0890508.1 unnamed protein product [Darwinula stevensoni]